MSIFKLPDLGEGLPDAEIHEWHIKEGDTVAVDQLLVSMETAKAVVDVPAPHAGVIKKLYGKVGDTINTGAPLLEYEEDASSTATIKSAPSAATVAGSIEVGDTVLKESAMGITPMSHTTHHTQTLPAIRLLAKRLGISLDQIRGSGPQGHITLDDFATAIEAAWPNKAGAAASARPIHTKVAGDVEPLKGVRKAMAQAMAQSHAEVVPVTILDEADLHAWPKGTDISVRLIRAIVAACKAEPALNAYFDTERQGRQLHKHVHLGLALDSEEGLFVPVIREADTATPEDLRETINRFKVEVGNRSISPKELTGATISLSNFGMIAGRFANPIIVPPMVAIIAAGRLREILVPNKEGTPEVHRVMPLSLSFDHRAATGGEATRFLGAMIKDLESKT
jgi:pyruvate dehydrogenase E2 component (dihydrolipoamide acetyltransferase)